MQIGKTAWATAAAALAAACAPEGAEQGEAPVSHYQIDAEFGEGHTLAATIRVTLPPDIANGDPSFFLGDRFTLDSVETDAPAEVNTQSVDEPLENLKLISLDFTQAVVDPVEVVFQYEGPLNPEDEDSYVVASADQIELRLDTMWFPVISTINFRFALDAEFTGVPADMVAVSQGEVTQAGETVAVHREMLDLDAPLVAARGLKKVEEPGVEVYAADFDWIVTDMMRRHALSSAEYFQEWFGPLPDGDMRLIVLPEASGGYARRGYIVTGEAREEAEEAPDFPESGPAKHIAHEFAHAWWMEADPFSPHYWLSESLAEYSSIRYVEHAFGLREAHEILERKRERAEAADSVLGEERPSGNSMYQRGAMILFEIERRVGRAAMDEIMARLGRDLPAVTSDFLRVIEEISGPEAAAEAEALLRSGPGPWEEESLPEPEAAEAAEAPEETAPNSAAAEAPQP